MSDTLNHNKSIELKLYNNILSLSRNKLFYTKFALDDTFQNRINLIFFHITFIFIKVNKNKKKNDYKLFYQKLFDLLFKQIEFNNNQTIIVAYEPIWAIGTGVSASVQDAGEMMGFIRGTLQSILSGDASSGVSLLYGGSVNANNISDYVQNENIDGVLVGGASLDPDSFISISRQISR